MESPEGVRSPPHAPGASEDLALAYHPGRRRGNRLSLISINPRAMYFEQSHNGMWVRAALLAYLFNVDGEIYAEHEKMFSRRHDYNEAVLG
jgi:hypothetical protein